AEAIYRQVLAVAPEHADALHLLGLLNHRAGNNEAAVQFIGQAICFDPAQALFWNSRGEAYRAMGQYSEAENDFRQALRLMPDYADAYNNLGIILHLSKDYENAKDCYLRAISIKPDHAAAYLNLGNLLQDQGKLDEGIACYRKVVFFQPNFAKAHNNMGNALRIQGKLDDAIASYDKAISLKPDYAEAYNNLGNALKDQGKLDDAIASYRKTISYKPDFVTAYTNLGNALQDQAKLDEAITQHRIALSLKPDFAEAYNNLGNVFQDQGKLDDAIASCHIALSLKPNFPEAHNTLGNTLKLQGKLDEAISCYRNAISFKPDYATAHNNLGNALKDQGKLDAALASYLQALSFKPDYAEAYSNLLFARLFDPNLSPAELLAESRRFAERFEAPLKPFWQPHNNTRDPARRLKLGYVSPDFRNHAVAFFIEPVLASHDKDRFEVFCYYNHAQRDDMSERIAAYADHWVPCKGWPDAQLAERIRSDGIDILVDLAGHTAHNRMLTFARKPAPVQIAYLGYPGTSGLSAMDYRLTDICTDPVGSEAFYSERLLRLPDSLWCYRLPPDTPEAAPLPALQNGYVTFGSFNNFNKVNRHSIELWAALLHVVQNSRLLMVTVPEGNARQALAQQFAALGVDTQRLEFEGKLPSDAFRKRFQTVDITLDPITVNGATTTCESISMGVPVISLTGARYLSRAGLSILTAAGLRDFAADSPEAYIKIAYDLAANLPLLADIRQRLPAQVKASPLVDVSTFTRNLEALYRDAWTTWRKSGG
ncbi:MAG: tetratricopeptide repeat protein, partial [Burkholderiales bacterium]